jgi:hypothetical protein
MRLRGWSHEAQSQADVFQEIATGGTRRSSSGGMVAVPGVCSAWGRKSAPFQPGIPDDRRRCFARAPFWVAEPVPPFMRRDCWGTCRAPWSGRKRKRSAKRFRFRMSAFG